LQTGGFQGFSRFRYVRLRKRAVLKSRIIVSHGVLRVARRRLREWAAVSQLRQVVRYSIRLRRSTAATHDLDWSRPRNRLVEWRTQAVIFAVRWRTGSLAGWPGFDRIAGLS